jgi:hypothetical protein
MGDYICITFDAGGRSVDLKVPAFITAGELAALLAEVLGRAFALPGGRAYKLQAEPLGCVLDSGETLEAQRVMDGALLKLL